MSATAFVEVDREDEPRIRKHFPQSIIAHKPLTDAGVLKQCKDAEILCCFIYSKIDRETLDQLPKLRLLCTRSVGYDHIDLAECEQRGITVCNVPDYGSYVIAEHVFALLLSTLRHIDKADKRVEGGDFDYRGLRGVTLRDKTIGIIGTGKIGRRVAQIAHGFGMRILAVDRCRDLELVDMFHVRYVLFEHLLQYSDIITLHAPLNEETKHMIDADAITQMRDGTVLVNTARGGLVDSQAVLAALESGKISYALLDVLEDEKDLQREKALIAHPNAITTPHIAFYADESVATMYRTCFDAIAQWQAGEEPEHRVHPPKIVCDLPGYHRKTGAPACKQS